MLTVLPAVCELLGPQGRFLTLVKPQFEAAREDVGESAITGAKGNHEYLLLGVRGERPAELDLSFIA